MQALPWVALALVALVAGAAAWRLFPGLPPRGRRALLAGAALAVPLAWLAALSLAERALGWLAPLGAAAFAWLVVGAILVFGLIQLAAVLLPEPRVWTAVAVVPVVAIVIASLEPRTTLGGVLAALLALVLLLAAAILPRGLALASVDRSRAFVALVAALALALGGLWGATLGVAAVREGGLGLAEAERTWSLTVASPDDAPYSFLAPFPVAEEGRAREVAQAWIASARVVQGEGSVRVESPGVLRVEGRGPLVVEAAYAFHAPAALREDVASFTLPDVAASFEGNVTAWSRAVATSGDGGRVCVRDLAADGAGDGWGVEAGERAWPDESCRLT